MFTSEITFITAYMTKAIGNKLKLMNIFFHIIYVLIDR